MGGGQQRREFGSDRTSLCQDHGGGCMTPGICQKSIELQKENFSECKLNNFFLMKTKTQRELLTWLF